MTLLKYMDYHDPSDCHTYGLPCKTVADAYNARVDRVKALLEEVATTVADFGALASGQETIEHANFYPSAGILQTARVTLSVSTTKFHSVQSAVEA